MEVYLLLIFMHLGHPMLLPASPFTTPLDCATAARAVLMVVDPPAQAICIEASTGKVIARAARL